MGLLLSDEQGYLSRWVLLWLPSSHSHLREKDIIAPPG